jgi:hypothetical protein
MKKSHLRQRYSPEELSFLTVAQALAATTMHPRTPQPLNLLWQKLALGRTTSRNGNTFLRDV